MFRQNDVFQWMSQLNVNILKHIITIKHPRNTMYLKKIITNFDDSNSFKPIDRMSHGYSQTNVKGDKGFYLRDNFRYKKKKEEKMAMDKVLFENITVSRVNSLAFSVKRSFIESGQLKKCLLLFSEEQVFNFYALKQMHVKLGGEKTPKSIWFEFTRISSFSEWLMSFFEIEIWEAFNMHQKEKIVFRNELNHLTFTSENITIDNVKTIAKNILVVYTERKHSGKYAKKTSKREGLFGGNEDDDHEIIDISAEEAQYLLTRCMERLEQGDRGLDQKIFEYEWYSQDKMSKVNKVMKDVCKVVVRQFKNYEIDFKAKEIESLNSCKKKKKKAKKNKDEKQEPEKLQTEKVEETTAELSTSSPPDKMPEVKTKTEEKPQQNEKTSIEVQSVIEKNEKKKSKEGKEEKSKEKVKKNEKNKPKTKHKKEQSLEKIQLSEKEEIYAKQKKVSLDNSKEEAKKVKKIVKQRINQHIFSFYEQLSLSSQSIDRYRKICIQTIENTIKEMELKFKWEIIVFGSYSVEFALRESDLDILIVVEDPNFTLNSIHEHIKVKQWLTGCNITQIQSAKVNILEFQIILSCLKHPKLKDSKKLKDVIHVDLSLTTNKDTHQGIRNTEILKQIFVSYPNIRVLSLIFKELLKVYELNKPFLGGIGSFVLVILVHNIIKMKGIENDNNYYQQLLEICNFMTDQFEPYKTLISSDVKTKLQINPKLELNIEDPLDKVLLNTTKIRQINEIIQMFGQLKMLLTGVETQLLEMNVEERKKMKKIFFEKWNILFRPHEITEDER